MTHELKCWPRHFDEIVSRAVWFSPRRDDRNFRTGDDLVLREYDPAQGAYTGRAGRAHVTCVVRDAAGMMPGYCIIGLFFFGMVVKSHADTDEGY